MNRKEDLSGLRILFITAGVGGANFEQAAQRLVNQASEFDLFTECRYVLDDEVLEICPRLLSWFNQEELSLTKGFGWYSWKSTIAYEAIVRERWGTYDLVMYLDAGCELFHSAFSESRLIGYLQHAMAQDRTLFAIPTPEMQYTKRDLFDFFPEVDPQDMSAQFQSGSWVLKSKANLEFVSEWEELASIGINMTDESLSRQGEHLNFVVHRYDQSIFSLASKKRGFVPKADLPPGNTEFFRSKIRAFFYPFWWSRNRTGNTLIPKWLSRLGEMSLHFFK